MNPLIQCKTTILPLLLAGVLACFALLPSAQAVSPPPDGGYPGGNTAEGRNSLFSLTTGTYNTAIGYLSLDSNSTGSFNTGVGAGSLLTNTGDQNTGTGTGALLSNTSGVGNTANGAFALFHNTMGNYNTANGQVALFNNSTGFQNTANGVNALTSNVSGSNNTASGVNALFNNSDGIQNTADGVNALFTNTSGHDNTGIGFRALFTNSLGFLNTAVGSGALSSNTEGVGNTAIGNNALASITTGSFNIAIGNSAGSIFTTGTDNICIGSLGGIAGESSTTRIANIYSSVASDRAVYINAADKLGTLASSRRYKEAIKAMGKASEALFALKPVTFRYKQQLDPRHIPMFGLVAEDVEKVDPDLVTRNEKGEAETVRYDAVNAMLLNEFLKEHRTVQELKEEVAVLTATVKQQAEQLEKVSAGVEMGKVALNVARNNQ
jgi:trimeric autotransporter adhesin